MKGEIVVYQTLEDRGNPKEIIDKGPFICTREDAWLGTGYYFWESFIENAHWWGKDPYVICEAKYLYNEDLCFNLIDNPEHIKLLTSSIELLKEKGFYKSKITTTAKVIIFLKKAGLFKFQATRSAPIGSKKKDNKSSIRFTKFNPDNKYYNPYLNLTPEIQICFYKKNSLGLNNYHIIYPDKYLYIDGYAV